MKNGVCPKCGSSKVHHGPTGTVARGWKGKDASFLPMTLWAAAQLTNYVCTACGYVERYVDSPADRETIAAKWEAVGGVDEPS